MRGCNAFSRVLSDAFGKIRTERKAPGTCGAGNPENPRVRVAHDKALPFEPLIPNAKTIKAMKEARRGKLPSFTTAKALLADLNADD